MHQWFIIQKCQKYLYNLQRQRIYNKDKHDWMIGDACPLFTNAGNRWQVFFKSVKMVLDMSLQYWLYLNKPMTDFFHIRTTRHSFFLQAVYGQSLYFALSHLSHSDHYCSWRSSAVSAKKDRIIWISKWCCGLQPRPASNVDTFLILQFSENKFTIIIEEIWWPHTTLSI